MKLQKFIITTLLSVSIIGTGIPANVSASSYAVTKHTYTLKINKKKQKKKAVGASYNGKNIKTTNEFNKVQATLLHYLLPSFFHRRRNLFIHR